MHFSKYKNSFYLILISLLLACTGEDGAVGPSGLNSLIQTSMEPTGSNCEFGGLKVESGIDNNSNGTLESEEVAKTDYICRVAGKNSLVDVTDEPAGATCPNGGIKIDSGIDEDEDGTLDEEEIDITRFVCNGIDGGFDEQIRLVILDLGSSGLGTGNASGFLAGDLIKFDITNWIGVDSTIFVTNAYTSNSTFSAIVELYNVTDDEVIAGSTVSTNVAFPGEKLETGNIFDNIPTREIDLKIRVRPEDASSSATLTGKSYLFLYRKD